MSTFSPEPYSSADLEMAQDHWQRPSQANAHHQGQRPEQHCMVKLNSAARTNAVLRFDWPRYRDSTRLFWERAGAQSHQASASAALRFARLPFREVFWVEDGSCGAVDQARAREIGYSFTVAAAAAMTDLTATVMSWNVNPAGRESLASGRDAGMPGDHRGAIWGVRVVITILLEMDCWCSGHVLRLQFSAALPSLFAIV